MEKRVEQELKALKEELASGRIAPESAEIGYGIIVANYAERMAAEAARSCGKIFDMV